MDGAELMRELRQAIKEGPRAALVSASRLPRRHPATFAMALGGVAIALLAFGYTDTRRDVDVIEPKVTQIIRSAAACQQGASRLDLRSCVRRIEIALERCRQSAACRSEFKSLVRAVRRKPASRPLGSARGGGAQNPSTAGQQPEPGRKPGARGGQAGGGKQGAVRQPRQPKPSDPPQPAPQPSSSAVPPPAPAPAPAPGNSGETPAPEVGVKACVDLIVSACVKADSPRLLP